MQKAFFAHLNFICLGVCNVLRRTKLHDFGRLSDVLKIRCSILHEFFTSLVDLGFEGVDWLDCI